MEQYSILGVNVTDVTYQQLYENVKDHIDNGSGLKLVFTPNPEIIYMAQFDPDIKTMLNSSDINLPDGIGVLIASKMLGHPIKERITGIDTMLYLCEKKAGSVFLFGSKPGIAELAAIELEKRYPGLKVVGFHDGYFQDDSKMVELINRSGADIVFVGLGAPKQENWLVKNKDKLQPKVAMVIGGSMDVISGTKKRAPQIFQKLNVEWVFRFFQEPSRFMRIIVLPKFLLRVILNCKK
ncbi:MAG: hypothetical protein A2X42_08985 [Candidatus Margulisbacteria bacterium GWF2_38_17]|nr:MAG: hypothetical protein A2X43_03365 [Candidatus Margulisbacteria bacterium GWD2_39_127]OGI02004.1 MAG: hypothetical protein A2X42_08985 [Candidatus Margulisbacteria bacterium GWF2_38_17]OGI11399.1 MAG: hypothetical protein A2X41_12120 [Candidatus Margulisbacteria bacterium GWE2_39_32]